MTETGAGGESSASASAASFWFPRRDRSGESGAPANGPFDESEDASVSRVGFGPRWGVLDAFVGFILSQAFTLAGIPLVSYLLVGTGDRIGAAAGAALTDERVLLTSTLPIVAVGVLQLPLWLTQLAAVIIAGERRGRGIVRDFHVRFEPSDLVWGVIGGIAAQMAAVIYVVGLLQFTDADLSGPARSLIDKASGPSVVLLFVIVAVMAPLIEELFFRGLLMRSLDKLMSVGWSTAVSSVIFGLVHFQLLQFPALSLVGLVFALIVRRTGRLGGAIVAHALFNATSVIALL